MIKELEETLQLIYDCIISAGQNSVFIRMSDFPWYHERNGQLDRLWQSGYITKPRFFDNGVEVRLTSEGREFIESKKDNRKPVQGNIIRWIHFSDLHLGDDIAVDTVLMRKKLPTYIAGLNQTFDYAFCTGDIKQWNADYTGAADYIRDLCSASKTPISNLFIVTGNHDVNIGGDDRTELIKKIKDWETDYYKSNLGVISADDMKLLRSGEGKFTAFVKELLGEDRAEYYSRPHFVIQTDDFNILHVDSTITYGRESDRDLIIGTRVLMDALNECDQTKPTILLTHYSYDFLIQNERDQVETLLDTYNVQLWFAGHEHEHLIRKQRDKFYECQCGNIALQKGARSCFLTGELDLKTGEGIITVHAWYEGKNWEIYPFARNGSDDDRIYPFALRLPGYDERPIDVSVELSNAREACARLSAPGGLFSGVTLNPVILTDLEWNRNLYHNYGSPSPLEQVMQDLWLEDSSHNALILGDGGMGKSTMMYHACKQLLEAHHLAIYISLQAQEAANNESITDCVYRSLYQSVDGRARQRFVEMVSRRHPKPDLVLFIDGFNELSGEGAQRYVAEIKSLAQFPGIQIIVSSRLDFLRDFGLSFFGMIRPCDLREVQVQSLFETRPEDWRNIEGQKSLRILVKNPMMALLYARTCPIVEKHIDLDYLDWVLPITNASDLLHDYYLSQIAILIDRQSLNAASIFNCMVAIDRVLPALSYAAERRNFTVWKETDFGRELRSVVEDLNNRELPEPIKRVQRRFRYHESSVDVNRQYDLIITELCLLRSGNGQISFAHQIFRDYLSAVHLHNALLENHSVEQLWHNERIHKGVVQYLRNIGHEETWGVDGQVSVLLSPYRGKEAENDDWFVANVIACWLSAGEGERDLSSLDLRKISLSDHLKGRFNGTINIDNAWVSKDTLINDRHHDNIVAMSFSHDNRTLAAVSRNGIISITNLITQSQMIIDQLPVDGSVRIGFDSDDYLIVKAVSETYRWPTIAYDKRAPGDENDILSLTLEEGAELAALRKRLRESDLDGICQSVSENGRYVAVGFESGFIQVWDVVEQECIANLSLSDSQITTVAFSIDGRVAALGSGGKLVQIWDMEREHCSEILYFDRRVNRVRVLKDSGRIECRFADGRYCTVDPQSGTITEIQKPDERPFVSKSLLKKLGSQKIIDIQSAPHGNAIVLTEKGDALVWDEGRKTLNACSGHKSKVKAIAVCSADERFAASYSSERYSADRDDGNRRGMLNGQQLVRVRIIKTGQCQWRLPTKGRSITKLQFFTSNRIVLAGYATNGDILLWELINEQKYGREIGRWESVEIVKNNQSEPIECAFPANKQNFISAYADGTLLIRPFSNRGNQKRIATLPGIDARVFRWKELKCDVELKKMLAGYPH